MNPAGPKAPLIALACAAGSFALILAATQCLLSDRSMLDGRNLIPGFLDIRFMWNRGISFSLFWQRSNVGSAILSVCMVVLVVGLGVYAARTRRPILAASLGMLIGGALANTLDRALHGAVFDYLVVRIGPLPLFVCNMADIIISAAVLGLLVDSYRSENRFQTL